MWRPPLRDVEEPAAARPSPPATIDRSTSRADDGVDLLARAERLGHRLAGLGLHGGPPAVGAVQRMVRQRRGVVEPETAWVEIAEETPLYHSTDNKGFADAVDEGTAEITPPFFLTDLATGAYGRYVLQFKAARSLKLLNLNSAEAVDGIFQAMGRDREAREILVRKARATLSPAGDRVVAVNPTTASGDDQALIAWLGSARDYAELDGWSMRTRVTEYVLFDVSALRPGTRLRM